MNRNLRNDRRKDAKIILRKNVNRAGLNMNRVDINRHDTIHGHPEHLMHKVHIGAKGGRFVIIHGKKRYLST